MQCIDETHSKRCVGKTVYSCSMDCEISQRQITTMKKRLEKLGIETYTRLIIEKYILNASRKSDYTNWSKETKI